MRASRSPVEETHLGWSAKAVCWTRAGKKQGEQGTRMEVHARPRPCLSTSLTPTLDSPSIPSLLPHPCPYSRPFASPARPGSPIQIPMLSPSSRTRTPTRAQVTAPDGEKMNSVINVRSHDLTIPYP